MVNSLKKSSNEKERRKQKIALKKKVLKHGTRNNKEAHPSFR